ncbi:DegT/DnrJ/EryC1/StrS family aminotransferase [Natrarchaeobius halalkaliphilus]|uniref:DegT/DnrJ/EryC1/StrS family aminotransferase n=1 Tax=Natrarchaeobius halalkaliphilus TaxID=1679091 RepID=A0A3N6M7C3_9EURY|nr:DegT/DnrJ/EryC1/StrS family aminotransferase [Natrarchaeobius halalkaliphilus]RQG91241.1 DegT/DnrJ/EryC1/StrS family aminotransferase [Natrarchaeobius halalkaliphilus]
MTDTTETETETDATVESRTNDRSTDGGVDADSSGGAAGSRSRPSADAEGRRDEPIAIADPALGDDAKRRVESVIDAGELADGPEVRAFEAAFADYCRTDEAVATSNGTTALHAALEALGVDNGDAVVTSPFSFVASANAIRLAGGTPVFADVDPETYTLDPHDVERVLAERDDVVGLLPVHLYGLAADMPSLCDLADDHDLFVLEDACQAHGAEIDGDRAGGLGDAACFSFYPTKNMTTGEGGIVTTDDADLADRISSYVNHGRETSGTGGYEHVRLGHNFRMTSLAAAIGRAQLERLPDLTRTRRDHAAYYDDRFDDLSLETPTEPPGYRHVYHQYTVRVDDRDGLRDALESRNVDSAVYYGTPIHRQPAYETVSTAAAQLPKAERAAETVLSLPVHPGLSTRDLETVAETVRDSLETT